MSFNHQLYDKILDHIDSDTVGVIWFSRVPLGSSEEKSDIHYVFDYLVDGRLSQFVEFTAENNIETENENNFFMSNNFNSSFILFNSSVNKEFSKKDFEDFKMILKNLDENKSKSLSVIYPEGFKVPTLITKSEFQVNELSY